MQTGVNLKCEIAKACRSFYEKDMIFAAGGNISACDRGKGFFVITPTGSSFRSVREDDLITLDMKGKVLDGDQKPSIEVTQHIKLYRTRPDINAIIHLHPPHVVAISAALDRFPLVTEYAHQVLGNVPVLENLPAGSSEVAEDTRRIFQDKDVKAAIIRRHALITVGSSMKEARDIAELVEESARVYLSGRVLVDKIEDFTYEGGKSKS